MNLGNKNTLWDSTKRVIFDPLFYNCTHVVMEAMQAGGIINNDFWPSLTNIATPYGLRNTLENTYNWQNTSSNFRKWLISKFDNQINNVIMRIKNKYKLTTGN